MTLNSLAILFAFASLANSLAHKAPRVTNVADSQEFDGRGWSPAPTPGPHELLRRNLFNLEGRVQGTTILVAEDATCGYLSGSAGAAFTCGGTSTCNLFTDAGFLGCCGSTNCAANIYCLNSVEYYSKSACNDVCEANTFTLKCSESSAPFCNTVTFPEVGVTDVYCAAKSVSSVQIISTNYRGQTFGGHFTPEVLTGTDSSVATTRPATSTNPITSSTPPTPPSTPPTIPPAPFTTSPLPNPTTTIGPVSKKSTPIGPIIGGVLGGVALLAAIGFGIWFIIRHNKKKSNNQAQPPPFYPSEMETSYGAGKPPAQVNQQEYYPNMTPSMSPNMQQQAPLQGYYGQEQPNPQLSPKPAAEQFGYRTQTISPSPVSPGRESYVSSAPAYHDHTYPQNVIHEVSGNPVER